MITLQRPPESLDMFPSLFSALASNSLVLPPIRPFTAFTLSSDADEEDALPNFEGFLLTAVLLLSRNTPH